MKKRMKKLCAFACAMALVAGMLPAPALAADITYDFDVGPNLVLDSGFDNERREVWSFTGQKGGYSSSRAYLEPKSRMSQTVNIPADGTYTLAAWICYNMSGAFGIGDVTFDLATTDNGGNPSNWYWFEEEIELTAGEAELFAATGSELSDGGWLNLDGVELHQHDFETPAPPADGNLLVNPDFEAGGAAMEDYFFGWTSNDGGTQTNNPHDSAHGFWLGGGAQCVIEQTVTVPFSGHYKTSAWITTAADGAVFGIKKAGGDPAATLTLPATGSYIAPFELETVEFRQGDAVTVYCSGAPYWTNGDDFSLAYDFTNITYNLLTDVDMADAPTVALPWDGNYLFTATMVGGGTVTVDGKAQTASDGETVTINVAGKEMGESINISLTGGTLTGASLTLDLSQSPNHAPHAEAVGAAGLTQDGLILTGATLVGRYTFVDEDEGQPGREGNSSFRWLVSDEKNGEFTQLGMGKLLTPNDSLAGKYLKFEVTPMDGFGMAGAAAQSEAMGPVQINYILDSSMEPEPGEDWAVRNGGSLLHGGQNDPARTGFWSAFLSKWQPKGEVFYTLEDLDSTYYTFGAWVKTDAAGGALGARVQGSQAALTEVLLPNTNGAYCFVELADIPVEAGANLEVYVRGAEGAGNIYADDFRLLVQPDAEEVPAGTNLFSFAVEKQLSSVWDSEHKTITVRLPYETDLSALTVTAEVSNGASITPASGTAVDFSGGGVDFTITNAGASTTWTVICDSGEQRLTLVSDNQTLEDGFNWAREKLDQFVMTGKRGLVNKDENRPNGTGEADYAPSYWCGYYDRTAYYSRDFVHQAVGGQIAGLWDENYNMFYTFAKNATQSRKWYTLWAFNFNNEPHTIDYHGDTNFVREVPAQFELVEKAYKQYLWSGDERYITDPTMWNFYSKTMTDFIELHDGNGNGVAEGTGGGIFEGSCTYNEMPGESAIEAGDAIGSQYQATLAYAAMLKEKGRIEYNDKYTREAEEWYAKAEELKRYFNEEWSVKDPAAPDGQYVRTLGKNGTKYEGFGYENSWFMPMKLVTEPGVRTDAYLDYIRAQMHGELSDHAGAHHNNIEAWSYLPDTFFPYNRSDDAWHYMSYILSILDRPHQRPSQGSNGDYPEISFTVMSQTIEGMMGLEADAANHMVATSPRLPSAPTAVNYVEAKYIQVGDRAKGGHVLDLRHDGLTKSTLSNDSNSALRWEARFYGEFDSVKVNEVLTPAQQKEINGVTVSYVVVNIPAGGVAVAEATTDIPAPGSHILLVNGGTGSGYYMENDKVEVAAIAPTGMRFASWVAEGVELGDNASKAGFTLTMPAGDVTLTASFVQMPPPPSGNGGSTPKPPVAVENPDGSKTTTITDKKTGAVTKTTEWPDGKKVEVVAAKTGDKTITVTDKDGNRAAELKLPAVIPAPVTPFTDIPDGHWSEAAANNMAGRGLITGTKPGVFDGDAPVTRGTFATILHRLSGGVKLGENSFADVKDGLWYSDAITWAAEAGVVSGNGAGFDPDGEITRESLAVMLYNYAGLLGVNTKADGVSLDEFADGGSVSAWAREAVDWAVKSGIFQGSGNNLNPNGTAKRAEAAALLARFIETLK